MSKHKTPVPGVTRRKFLAASLTLLASACTYPLQPRSGAPAPAGEGGTPPAARPGRTPRAPASTAVPSSPAAPILPSSGQGGGGGFRPPVEKPNIIYLVTDDLNTETLDHMPKLNALLRQQGITFRNYIMNFPLCCPSRTAVLTGMYAHSSGIYSNSDPAGGFGQVFSRGLEKNMVGAWLQAAGYHTALVGKYLNGYPGGKKNQAYVPPGWTEWYSSNAGNAYAEFNYTLNENGKDVSYGNKPEDYGTDVYARKALDFMQRSVKEGKPFFVYVSVYAPHSPATPAPRHANLFPDAKAPRTPNFDEEDLGDKPLVMQRQARLTAKQIAEIDKAYRERLQSVQAVDEMIASFYQMLESTGQANRTYFFFTSDNGFHQGQHRLPQGKTHPYEEDICCPMFVRGPGIPAGQVSEALVGNVDLAPTFAGLAGAQVPANVDGRSLVPLLNGSTPSQWRQAFLIENGAPVDIPDTYNPKGKNRAAAQGWSQGIRTRAFTYVEYKNGEREFYDLQKDPYQLQNLVAKLNPQSLKQLSAYVNRLRKSGGSQVRSTEEQPLPEVL